ncbi:MAG TPA: M23 family metallopeptidase, partial [Edaphobacter sp.]|nr:M23 family metallopeptidase [Edaphobacter sp.]
LLAILPAARAQRNISISWQPEELESGTPSLFLVKAPGAEKVIGTWQGHSLDFFKIQERLEPWYALGGIDVGVKAGSYDLAIEVTRAGKTEILHRTIEIAPAPYKEVPLTVPEKFVQPDPAAQKIIAADQKIKDRIFASTASAPLWIGSFSPPLRSTPRTDSFGTRRVFNGSLASVHRGLDYRAKTGTPVMAANSGRVVLARPLYYEGNCVIIDHGLGLATIYMHLSKFDVKEGEQVRRGQLIGQSGATGRATGPHLHLSVRWQGESLDPAKLFLLKLPLPQTYDR